MFVWRNAVVIGVAFVAVGVTYLWLQGGAVKWLDPAGTTLLILLGAAMTFTFSILLRGSRGL